MANTRLGTLGMSAVLGAGYVPNAAANPIYYKSHLGFIAVANNGVGADEGGSGASSEGRIKRKTIPDKVKTGGKNSPTAGFGHLFKYSGSVDGNSAVVKGFTVILYEQAFPMFRKQDIS